jgi:hypothetical protein
VSQPRDLSQRDHRRLIGFLGLFLPGLVYVIAGGRSTEGLTRWRLLDSVSAYYYTGSVAVFVGVLFALSLFLFTYRGYEGVSADRIVGRIGGLAAMGVALFPTEAPKPLPPTAWWSPKTSAVHFVSAVVLFGTFILFALWLFRLSSVPNRRERRFEKRMSDHVYLACGLVMIGAVAWAAVEVFRDAPIFWPETIALEAFAISWLTKGDAHCIVVDVARRMRRGAKTAVDVAPGP